MLRVGAPYAVAGILESFNLRRFDKGFTLKDSEIPGQLLPGKEPSPELDAVEDATRWLRRMLADSRDLVVF